MERKTKPLTVQISKHLHTRVKTSASVKGLKLKELVVEALIEKLEKEGFRYEEECQDFY